MDLFIEPQLEFRDGCLKSWLLEYSGTGVFICSVLEIRVHVSFVVGVCESGVCLCLECRYLWGLWVRCRYAMMCEYFSYLQIMIVRIFWSDKTFVVHKHLETSDSRLIGLFGLGVVVFGLSYIS